MQLFRVEVLSDKGTWYSDGPKFDSVDDAIAHVHDLLLRWIIVEWRVLDDNGIEVKHGFYP